MMKKSTKNQLYGKLTINDDYLRLLDAQSDAEKVYNGLGFLYNLKNHSEMNTLEGLRQGKLITNPTSKMALEHQLKLLLKLNESVHVYLSSIQESIEE